MLVKVFGNTDNLKILDYLLSKDEFVKFRVMRNDLNISEEKLRKWIHFYFDKGFIIQKHYGYSIRPEFKELLKSHFVEIIGWKC